MWKIFLAFVAFAALGLFIMKKSGADIDMGGEKHGADAVHAAPTATAPSASASTATAPSASAPSPAASK
jgi:hypothetical protein